MGWTRLSEDYLETRAAPGHRKSVAGKRENIRGYYSVGGLHIFNDISL